MSVNVQLPEWPASFEDAASHTELVVLADVVSVRQGTDIAEDPAFPDYRMPTQLTTIQVVKDYKGPVTPGQSLVVYQPGIGMVTDLSSPLWSDDIRGCNTMLISADDEPFYQAGERYVLALTPVVFSEEVKGLQPDPFPEGMVRTPWLGRLLVGPEGTASSGETLDEIEGRIAALFGGEYATPTSVPTPAPPYPIPTPAPFPGDFQVTLFATPQEGTAPLIVQLRATLSGGPDNSYELYCTGESWDFGGGIRMERIPDCVEWTPEARIRRSFTTEYTYEQAGTYQIRLQVGEGAHSLASNGVTIEVR